MFPPLLQRHDQFAEPMAETLFNETKHKTAVKKDKCKRKRRRFINATAALFICNLNN